MCIYQESISNYQYPKYIIWGIKIYDINILMIFEIYVIAVIRLIDFYIFSIFFLFKIRVTLFFSIRNCF